MNIALITNEYPLNDDCKGAGYYAYYLAKQLTENGHEVHVILPATKDQKPGTHQDKKIHIHIVPRSWPKLFQFLSKTLKLSYFGALQHFAYSKSIHQKIKYLNRKKHFDIIEMPEGGGIGFHTIRDRKNLKSKTILKLHSPLFHQYQFNDHKLSPKKEILKKISQFFTKKMELYCIRRATEVVAPSQSMAEIIQPFCPKKKIHIIPNSIDLKKFHPAPAQNARPDTINILTVTTLSKLKGSDLLIETALETIKLAAKSPTDPQPIFHIIGNDTTLGASNKSYKQHLIEKFDIADHPQIIFHGYKTHSEILKHYHQANIYISTSRTESFGISILEALACGVPTIAFATGAIPEIITDQENGILIPTYKTKIFAKKIIELSQNHSLQKKFRESGLERAKNFSLEKQIKASENLYLKKKALFINYFFPPYNYSATHRIAKFAKYLPKFNYTPIILRPNSVLLQNTDPTLLEDLGNNYIDAPAFSFAKFFKKSTPQKSAPKKSASPKSAPRTPPHSSRPKTLDSQIIWLPFAIIKGLTQIKKHKPAVIFASGYPFSLFIAATILKKLTKTPSVLSFHDPWTLNPYINHNTRLNQAIEKWVIKNSDSCIFTTQATTNIYQNAFPKFKNKFHTIYNGFDPEDFKTKSSSKNSPLNPKKFNIVYTGTLNASRSPKNFLTALEQLFDQHPELKSKIEVHFFGASDSAFALTQLPPHTCHFHGFTPHNECLQHLQSADLLLFITGDEPGGENILAGKVFEYLAAQKPILAMTYPKGETAKILKKSPQAKIILQDDTEAAAKTLFTLYKSPQTHTITPQDSSSEIEKFSRKNLTEQLAKIFDQLN